VELIKPRCQICGTTPVIKGTKHLFLDLSKLSGELEKWVLSASEKGKWQQNALSVTQSWLKEGLKPRCITRDLKWGTPVPLDGYRDKVFFFFFSS
jgi:methionyl-tRNA synthetase